MKSDTPNVLLFSRSLGISVADVRRWLDRQRHGDDSVKEELIKFLDHRLRGRYITPLLNVPPEFKSGFLMTASACLLIEAIQTFYDGKNESRDPNRDEGSDEIGSEAAFIRFFEANEEFFPALRETFHLKSVLKGGKTIRKCAFYKHIRCGILHQAETTGRYSIVRDESPLFDPSGKSINANKFLQAVENCLNKYIAILRAEKITSELWEATGFKLKHICDNFECA